MKLALLAAAVAVPLLSTAPASAEEVPAVATPAEPPHAVTPGGKPAAIALLGLVLAGFAGVARARRNAA